MVPGHECYPTGRITARQTRASRQAGFTMAEVLIATAIVAVIAAIAIPSYSSYRERVDLATAETDIRNIEQAVEQYYLDNSGYPGSLNDVGLGGA